MRTSRGLLDIQISAAPVSNGQSAPVDISSMSVLNECHLSQQIGLTVLEVLASFVHHTSVRSTTVFYACICEQDRLESGLPEGERLIGSVIELYISLMDEQWSEAVRLHATAALAAFITKVG
jgi:hypothetical protein